MCENKTVRYCRSFFLTIILHGCRGMPSNRSAPLDIVKQIVEDD